MENHDYGIFMGIQEAHFSQLMRLTILFYSLFFLSSLYQILWSFTVSILYSSAQFSNAEKVRSKVLSVISFELSFKDNPVTDPKIVQNIISAGAFAYLLIPMIIFL